MDLRFPRFGFKLRTDVKDSKLEKLFLVITREDMHKSQQSVALEVIAGFVRCMSKRKFPRHGGILEQTRHWFKETNLSC